MALILYWSAWIGIPALGYSVLILMTARGQ